MRDIHGQFIFSFNENLHTVGVLEVPRIVMIASLFLEIHASPPRLNATGHGHQSEDPNNPLLVASKDMHNYSVKPPKLSLTGA